MSGELQLGNTVPGQAVPVAPAAPAIISTRVVELKNMLSDEDLENEEEYNEILEDTRAECAQFGQLVSVHIPKKGEEGATKIFLEYATIEDANKAITGLQGRTFDGRKVEAAPYDEARYSKKEFSS